jgi:hypothetical protein
MKQYLNNNETTALAWITFIAWIISKAVAVICITAAILLATLIVEAGYAVVVLTVIGVGLMLITRKYIAIQVRNWYLLKRDGFVTEYHKF